MASLPKLRVQTEEFDAGCELNLFTQSQFGMGAVVSFSGIVRDVTGGLQSLEIEHYPGMTERAIESILAEAVSRWDLGDALVIHRYGSIPVGAPIMMVATAAPHRSDAFQAAEFLMDYLKSRAPFWKKEVTRQGSDWVAAQDHDEDALKRW